MTEVTECICNDEKPQWRYIWISSHSRRFWPDMVEAYLYKNYPITLN